LCPTWPPNRPARPAYACSQKPSGASSARPPTEILPGLTRTGIIVTRYRGDRAREKAYFDQFKIALDPEDVARVIAFALEQPPHVQIAEIMVLPVNRY
jgi:3-hydroxy acid dehydrogenase/malonic semialdehyde reductase